MPSRQARHAKMLGGFGAADYATSVYGNAGSQHAAANGVIAMGNPASYGNPMVGGRMRKTNRKTCRRGSKKCRKTRRSSQRK